VDQQTRQALKHDQFVDTTQHGLEWAGQHRRSLLITGVIALAVIAILAVGAVVFNSRSEKAAIAFGEAMQTYQTPLAAPGQQVPPGVKTSIKRVDDRNQLKMLLRQAATVPALRDFQRSLPKSGKRS